MPAGLGAVVEPAAPKKLSLVFGDMKTHGTLLTGNAVVTQDVDAVNPAADDAVVLMAAVLFAPFELRNPPWPDVTPTLDPPFPSQPAPEPPQPAPDEVPAPP